MWVISHVNQITHHGQLYCGNHTSSWPRLIENTFRRLQNQTHTEWKLFQLLDLLNSLIEFSLKFNDLVAFLYIHTSPGWIRQSDNLSNEKAIENNRDSRVEIHKSLSKSLRVKICIWYFFTCSSSKRSLTLGFPLAVLPLAVKLDGSWLFDRGGELWPTGSKPNLLQSTFPLPFSVISSILLKLHPSKAQAWKNSEDLAGPWKKKLR